MGKLNVKKMVYAALWIWWATIYVHNFNELYQKYPDGIGYDAKICWEAGHGNTTHTTWLKGGGWWYGEPARIFFVVVTYPFTKADWTFLWMVLCTAALVDTVRKVAISTGGWILSLVVVAYADEITYCGNSALILAWLLTTPVGLNVAGMVKFYLAPVACIFAAILCYDRSHSETGTSRSRSVSPASIILDTQTDLKRT